MRSKHLLFGLVIVLLFSACGSGQSAPSGASPGAATSTENLVAKVKTGIIRVQTSLCDGTTDIGTGFIVGPRLVATVEHVVDGAAKITLLRDGRVLAQAVVIGEDPARDLALLRTRQAISGYRFQFENAAPGLGEDVLALGFPLGLPLTVTHGSVSGLDRAIPIQSVTRRQLVQTDAAVNPGNSGGPLLATDTGKVVGLVDLGTSQANAIAFAVSAGVASPLLTAWKVAPQPIADASCAGVTLGPGASAAPSGATGSDLGSYAIAVARLLDESAAVRKQLVSAIAQDGSAAGVAGQTLASVVAARRAEVATAEAMSFPQGAAATQASLVRAFRLSLASDLLYQRWVNTQSQPALAQAQANDTTTVAAKATFVRAYNSLRANAGLPPIPTSFPF